MKQTLSREHRKILETTVAQARVHAEAGAEKALKALAVAAKEAPAHAGEPEKKLRVRLRAHGRALGDLLRPDGTQAIDHLVTEIAYEHWHRMLFARFLAESDLLMHPDGYPVSLADCEEDAEPYIKGLGRSGQAHFCSVTKLRRRCDQAFLLSWLFRHNPTRALRDPLIGNVLDQSTQ